MSKFVLIGGRSQEFCGESKIYREMLKMAPNKTILYIPYANQNYENGYQNFLLQVPKDAKVVLASFALLENIKDLEKLFAEAGTIFFCGGSANQLVDIVTKKQIDKIINKFLDTDKVFAGISAGAILFAKYGMGDKDVFFDNGCYYNFKMVQGLGILPLTICPHYQKPELVIYNDIARKYPFSGFALEDDTALFLFDKKVGIIKDARKNSLYYLNKERDYLLIPLYERN